jgi:hypothetical protein
MAIPAAIRNALDNLWDQFQASAANPDERFFHTRVTLGGKIYKVRITAFKEGRKIVLEVIER